MEFKFRDGDSQPRQFSSSPSTVGGFSEQGVSDKPAPLLRRNIDLMRKPRDMNEVVLRELDMMRFREAAILAEIERQRILTEEARRELMMVHRQMAIQNVSQREGLSFYEPRRTPFNSMVAVVHPFDERQPEEQLINYGPRWSAALSMMRPEESLVHDDIKQRVQADRSGPIVLREQVKNYGPCWSDALAMMRPEESLVHNDIKQQVQADKSGPIKQEKPDPKPFNAKRKAEMPLATAAAAYTHKRSVAKTPKKEWSCALCQVTATSEIVFNEHLQGKKHKSNTAGLIDQKKSKTSQALNKRRKLLKTMETIKETRDGLNRETISLNNRDDEHQVSKECVETPNIKLHEALSEKNLVMEAVRDRKKFKFWCTMCNVGAFVQAVMDAHVKGKKHMARLQEVGPNYGAAAVVLLKKT